MKHEQLEFPLPTRREWENAISRLGDHVKEVEAARFAIRAAYRSAEMNEESRFNAETIEIGRR